MTERTSPRTSRQPKYVEALIDVLANDERAVALVTVRGERNDEVLDERQIVVFELNDSTVATATFVYERPAAHDAFWS